MNTPKLYTPQELAETLSLNVMTIYRYIKEKKIKAIKIGKHQYRIKQTDLDTFLESK